MNDEIKQYLKCYLGDLEYWSGLDIESVNHYTNGTPTMESQEQFAAYIKPLEDLLRDDAIAMDKIDKVRQRNDAIIRACQSVDPDFVVRGEDQDQERWTVCYNYSDNLGWLPVDNFFNLYGTAWVSTKEKALEACALLTQWKTEELFRGSKTMPKYSHMLDVAFTVISEAEDGSDITPEQIHLAIAKRLVSLAEANDYDIGGSIGHCDTYQIEEQDEDYGTEVDGAEYSREASQ